MRVLHQAHPEMIRNHPFSFIFCLIITIIFIPTFLTMKVTPITCILGLLGPFCLLQMWLTTKSEMITIDEEKTIIRKGLIAKHTSEIFHHDVQIINVSQGIVERIFDVGTLQLGSAAGKIGIKGIRNPQQVKEICNSLKKNHVVMVRQVL